MKVTTCSHRPLVTACSLPSFEYQIDPYVGCGHLCRYCYALEEAETDWSGEVQVHRDIEKQLEEELEGISPQTIYMGYHTDPYQPVEEEKRQTRLVLEKLLERGFSASILTKSDLVLRDADILARMPEASVSVSVAFTDDKVRSALEHDTMETGRRIKALEKLKAAGVSTSALICPVIPHVTDAPSLVKDLSPHSSTIWVYRLTQDSDEKVYWKDVEKILTQKFPDEIDEIKETILTKTHPYWTNLEQSLSNLETDSELRIFF